MFEIHENASGRLDCLPDHIEIRTSSAMSDGGTISLHADLPNGKDLIVSLSPIDSFIYPGRGGVLSITEGDRANSKIIRYEVAPRSELLTQIVALLKTATCRTSDSSSTLNAIVTFVESDRYDELDNQSSSTSRQ